MKKEDKIMAAGIFLIGLYFVVAGSLIGFCVWVVYKLMQHFGVI